MVSNMSTIKKNMSLLILLLLAVSFSGCIPEEEENGSGSNSLELSQSGNDFTMTLHSDGVGGDSKFYHVLMAIGSLSKGSNYSGTVTTQCLFQGFSGFDAEYSCETTYSTSSPIGDPQPTTTQLSLKSGLSFDVTMEEKSFSSSDVTTVVGTIIAP